MRPIDADIIVKKNKEKIERLKERVERLEKEKDASFFDLTHRIRRLQDRIEDCYLVIEVLNEAPIIDTEPVRHGKWEYAEDEVLDDLTFSAWKCSCCGYYAYKPELWHYCPRCGAKMDKG